MISIDIVEWETIRQIWTDHLWPDRKSPIEPVSSIKFMGGYDLSIKSNAPTFLGAFTGKGECIGVNSGFATSQTHYRSRGLYVFPEWRGKGVGQSLLIRTIMKASDENKNIIWSMPRKESLGVYESVGYLAVSDFFDKDVEFGPNCYVIKYIGG
jgi:GNAT superfamily N-acetyltransferase